MLKRHGKRGPHPKTRTEGPTMAPNSRVSPSRPALPATAALLIFDLPKAFQVSEREAEINAARLLATWRAGGVAVP